VPEALSEVPEALSEVPEALSEVPEALSEVPEVLSEVPEVLSEVPEVLSQVPEALSQVPEALSKVAGLPAAPPPRLTGSVQVGLPAPAYLSRPQPADGPSVERQAGRPEPFRELERWRRELNSSLKGCPTHPIAVALQPVIERYQIPIRHFEEVIAGVEMDLTPRRYATFEELRVYCERVASAVGWISIRVFGCQHPASERYATNLGIALQLTNILRDLKPDLDRGRLYLPLSELSQFGLSESNLAYRQGAESFQRLMGFQAARARGFFRCAEEALKETGEARKLLPARIMGGIYAQLLRRIEAIQYQVFSQRVSVPCKEQLWIAARTLVCTP